MKESDPEKVLVCFLALVTTGAFAYACYKGIEIRKIHRYCTLILINNHEIQIYDNVPTSISKPYKNSCNYDVTELNDQNWLIYVYGSDASQYSEFIASNIYFDENNKVILDSLNLTDENFEYFINNENSNGNSRVRKG